MPFILGFYLAIRINNISPPISSSDHNVIEFSIVLPCPLSNVITQNNITGDQPDHTTLYSYDWNSANFESINAALSEIDWHLIFGFYFDVESIWSKFKATIWPIIVPKTVISYNKKYRPRNYPRAIQILLNRKAAIWRMLRLNKSDALKQKYANIVSECKHAIFKLDQAREEKILKANNLGAFYKFVNGKLNTHNGIAPLTDSHGNVLTSDVDKANLLNDFLKSVFTQDNGTLPHFPSRLPPNSPAKIDDININEIVIKRILSKLKTNPVPGPDRLPPIFYNKTSASISFPLCIIFRTFVDLKNLPAEWKKSIVTPEFKKGNQSIPSNYRPIALTCTCCKILESIISGELNDYLFEHNLISKTQHGFLKCHSTTTNLLESLHDWTLSLSNHKSVIIATIDFQRAFDSISHSKLIHKLKSYGISGNLLFWLQSFLTARTQCVRVGSALSIIIIIITCYALK